MAFAEDSEQMTSTRIVSLFPMLLSLVATLLVGQAPVTAAKPLAVSQARMKITGARHNRPDDYKGIGDFIGWPGGIDRLPNGDLLVTHSSGYWHSSFAMPRQIEPGLAKRWRAEGWPLDFEAPTGGRTMGCRSTDGGRTWSKPFTILDHRLDDGAHAVMTLPGGRIICLVGVQASWYGYMHAPTAFAKDIDGLNTKQFVIHSDDNGKTWSKPRGLKCPGDYYERGHGGRPVLLSDGSILWATYYQVRGRKFLSGAIRRSTDNGLTWPVISRIVRKDNAIDEPAIAELKDGRLVLVTRPDGAIFHSPDKGRTWKDSGSRVVNGGGKFKAPQLAVLADGTLVAFATWRNLRAWISRDGGMTWTKDLPLDIGSYGYPGSYILEKDGSILFPYCASGRAPNAVYLLRFRVNAARNGVELLPVVR
ncbi:MAG: sialidase family protein [Planctomycetota bacterium]|nr:sialidase family protein [Planctomycetota bacterium]